jgi:hypothetical protein
VLIGWVVLWTVLRMIPGAASSVGMRGGHEFTFLRWGSMYTEVDPGAWLFGSPKRRSSLAFASAGERIVLESRTSLKRGRVVLSVYSGTWGGRELHNAHLTSSGPYSGQVSVPESGFYRVTANYVFTFRGRHDLTWRVE